MSSILSFADLKIPYTFPTIIPATIIIINNNTNNVILIIFLALLRFFILYFFVLAKSLFSITFFSFTFLSFTFLFFTFLVVLDLLFFGLFVSIYYLLYNNIHLRYYITFNYKIQEIMTYLKIFQNISDICSYFSPLLYQFICTFRCYTKNISAVLHKHFFLVLMQNLQL